MGSDPAGRVVVLCHDPHQLVGVVARLIDPALPEPHRFMPAQPRRRDDRQPNPTARLRRSSAFMKTEPDNPIPAMVAVPGGDQHRATSPASRPFVLAALRAQRLDPDCG